MSGFERSAPVPGSQGPRRSQMKRFNNAPPPESPWRLEVLEAKKAAEAAMRKAKEPQRSRSRSRSRSRHHQRERSNGRGDRDRRKGSAAATSSSSRRKEETVDTRDALMKKMAKVREVGEGWFAAVSAASGNWDSVPENKRPPSSKALQEGGGAGAAEKRKAEERRRPDMDSEGREELQRKAREEKARLAEELEEESRRREDQTNEQERLEKQWQSEAEARERRRLEEKAKLDEDKKAKQSQEKQRRQKLGNAFAMDGDDDDDDDKRKKKESDMLRKASERKRAVVEATSVQQSGALGSTALMLASGAKLPGDKDLSSRLGFDDPLDPATAFIRLQERKRKGRRAEFGGPPRGCSPWRDGKRGVITPIAQGRIDREGARN